MNYIQHVPGRKVKHILVYALSTCVWCRRVKSFLQNEGLEFDFIDVDMLDSGTSEQVEMELQRWNPRHSFPTIVINQEQCLVGFDEVRLREVLEL